MSDDLRERVAEALYQAHMRRLTGRLTLDAEREGVRAIYLRLADPAIALVVEAAEKLLRDMEWNESADTVPECDLVADAEEAYCKAAARIRALAKGAG